MIAATFSASNSTGTDSLRFLFKLPQGIIWYPTYYTSQYMHKLLIITVVVHMNDNVMDIDFTIIYYVDQSGGCQRLNIRFCSGRPV